MKTFAMVGILVVLENMRLITESVIFASKDFEPNDCYTKRT